MSHRPRNLLRALVVATALVLFLLAFARWSSFHNETFDLAFYGRMAWGPLRLVFWDPIVGAHMLGLHVSLVILPLSLVSLVPGAVIPALLAIQAAAVAAAAVPMAKMAERRFGPWGALIGAGAWLLYPNIAHVATYEWHPGTLAVLPLSFALEALDRRAPRAFMWAVVGVLACREDLGLCTFFLGLLALREGPAMRSVAKYAAAGSVLYVALFLFVLLPLLGPVEGSVQLHFGKWGESLPQAALGMLTDPIGLAEHLLSPARLGYLPRLLAPLALLPLLSPRWLVPTIPIVMVNFLSDWPTTTQLDSHYQTTLLPFLVAGAIDGLSVAAAAVRMRTALGGLFAALVITHVVAGGSPLAMDFDRADFTRDERSDAAAASVAEIPAGASVQAPYALMPHLVERELISAAPPPDKNYAFVILDAWQRQRYAQREALLRTSEEPNVRDWLARRDYGLVGVEPPYLVFSRGHDPRAYAEAEGILRASDEAVDGRRLAECLSLIGAVRRGHELTLELAATGPCGSDMAIRIGVGRRPVRVDLLLAGVLSPAHLRPGDRLRSVHALSEAEARAFDEGELRVGLLRSSGARPAHGDPVSITCR